MSVMAVLTAMLRRAPYGPGRGLKKPRGKRAKAEVRRRARHVAHVRATEWMMTDVDLRRVARHALLKLGRSSRDLRGVGVRREIGLLTLMLRAMPQGVARQVLDAVRAKTSAAVSIDWRFA